MQASVNLTIANCVPRRQATHSILFSTILLIVSSRKARIYKETCNQNPCTYNVNPELNPVSTAQLRYFYDCPFSYNTILCVLIFMTIPLLSFLCSYNSDFSDSYGEEGSLWSFNYFFYNKKLKRIVFFTCQALSPTAERDEVEDMDDVTDTMELDQTMDSAYESFTVYSDPGWQLPPELITH